MSLRSRIEDALRSREENRSEAFIRRDRWAVPFAAATVAVLVMAYIPIIRTHPGWEDEVYWASTCLSMLRHKGSIPSVLVDYARPANPLQFYGPTLFWLATVVLKIFGLSMRTWRSFTFAGDVAYLVAIASLFCRLRRSWTIAMGAALFCALSIAFSFEITLPGRPDSWTLALVVFAMAIVATESADGRRDRMARWFAFGTLLGFAASTTPRVWPLLFFMVLLLPLRVGRGSIRAIASTVGSCLVVWSVILLPLRMTIWGFVAAVHRASAGDAVDVSPLMGGRWSFGHATTQIVYFGALLFVVVLLDLPRWRQIAGFQRWLIAVAALNLTAALLLTARSLNMFFYWGFLIEIAALCTWTEAVPGLRLQAARAIGLLLFVFMVTLRIAREAPVLMHWKHRDPSLVEQELRANIPPGSVVYGLPGRYFYPSLTIGADYRHPVDWSSTGRASTPGHPGLPAPMRDACHAPTFLVWPAGIDALPLPPTPYATPQRIAEYFRPSAQLTAFERWIEKVPGGTTIEDPGDFTIYRLLPHAQYCREVADMNNPR
jgi:hypothetical protein